MLIVIESITLCIIFTIMVYIISRNPIKTLYNYPPRIQERVKSIKEYKDLIPNQDNKIKSKISACLLFIMDNSQSMGCSSIRYYMVLS